MPSHRPGKQDENAAKPPNETEKRENVLGKKMTPYLCDRRKTRPTRMLDLATVNIVIVVT